MFQQAFENAPLQGQESCKYHFSRKCIASWLFLACLPCKLVNSSATIYATAQLHRAQGMIFENSHAYQILHKTRWPEHLGNMRVAGVKLTLNCFFRTPMPVRSYMGSVTKSFPVTIQATAWTASSTSTPPTTNPTTPSNRATTTACAQVTKTSIACAQTILWKDDSLLLAVSLKHARHDLGLFLCQRAPKQ